MDYQKITDYPEHPEPTPASEHNREERPRTPPSSVAFMGAAALLVIVLLPFIFLNTELKQLWKLEIRLDDLMKNPELFRGFVLIVAAAAGLILILLVVFTVRVFTPNIPGKSDR